MSLDNSEKLGSGHKLQEQALVGILAPDAEMVPTKQNIESAIVESKLNADMMPANGNDALLTQDTLASITESVWQHIRHRLDAKHSRHSNE